MKNLLFLIALMVYTANGTPYMQPIQAAMPTKDVIAWEPHEGPQTIALQRREREILYGGARGGGKTDAGMAWMVEPEYISNPNYRGLVLRKNADDLSDWTERAKVFYKPLGVKISGKPAQIRFKSGALIRLGHLKDKNAYAKYHGHEYQKILIEELTQIPDEADYEKVISACRTSRPELVPQIFCTTNPGGPGHVWVKHRFIDKAFHRTYVSNPEAPEREQMTRIFIQAKMTDNPTLMKNDPVYVWSIRSIKDVKLRNAWEKGDWATFSGQYFDAWDPMIHVVSQFKLDPDWPRFRGFDWGYSPDPAAMVWVAVDYNGRHIVYREFEESNNVPHKCAEKINRLSVGPDGAVEHYESTRTDNRIWAEKMYATGKDNTQQTTRTIYDVFVENGVFMEQCNQDRVPGWTNIRELLYHDENHPPQLVVMDHCTKLIEAIPALAHDDHKVEDVAPSKVDHLPDALRDICMHTPKDVNFGKLNPDEDPTPEGRARKFMRDAKKKMKSKKRFGDR